ncbi:hypothetical protein GYMLUDRAFT_238965 [Collybiopsis luxurians FD-317 M1]|nr:hypothetical protein GYMLUDRAFT_238965 [Collybiopsis luxurians FD-317 M1]
MILSQQRLTPTHHRSTYPAISPTKPSLSQTGKTILITGGGGGIGFDIARSFTKASASRIIIVGRRGGFLDAAVTKLRDEFGANGPTEFIARQGDISDDESMAALWDHLHAQNILVHVLVLNAAQFTPVVPDTLSLSKNELMEAFNTNVGSNFYMSTRFVQQPLRSPAGQEQQKLFLVNVSSCQIHMYPSPTTNAYAATKTAFTALLGRIADERKVEDVQIVSYHPGAQYSEIVSNHMSRDSLDWDEMSLAADYAVWAASPEASWLHGRYVYAHWDVDEFKNLVNELDSDVGKLFKSEKGYLKAGIIGLGSVSYGEP